MKWNSLHGKLHSEMDVYQLILCFLLCCHFQKNSCNSGRSCRSSLTNFCHSLKSSGFADVASGLRLGLQLGLGLGIGLGEGKSNKLQLNYNVTSCKICRSIHPIFTHRPVMQC